MYTPSHNEQINWSHKLHILTSWVCNTDAVLYYCDLNYYISQMNYSTNATLFKMLLKH